MAKINTLNYQTVASWNGSQDLFIVEQPDGTKVATPAMIKQYVLAGVTETSEQYAESSTARNVTAKTVTLPGFELETGARISVRFTDTGTSNPASGNLTLNVNGTGAKEIVDSHTNKTKLTYTSGGLFYNNIVNDFIYDGTYWVYMNRDNNTTYSSKTAASGGTATSLCTTGEKYTWNNKQSALTFDNVPTQNSNNPVKSGGIYSKIGDLSQTGLTGDSVADQLADIAANLIIPSAGSSITVTMPVVWGYFYPDQYTAKVPIPTIAPNTNYTITLAGVKADNVPATVDLLTGAEVVSKNNTYFEMRTPRNLSSYALPNQTSCRIGMVRYTITFA